MFEKDVILKKVLSDKENFADLINTVVYDGKEMVSPEQLVDMPEETDMILSDKNNKWKTVSRYRDILAKATFDTKYVIFACENQSEIHYAMVIRNMLYDALSYSTQVQNTEKKNRRNKEKMKRGEFLSGLKKTDKLIPVVTLVLYYAEQEWDGELDLYSMLDMEKENSETLKKYIPNYHINFINARKIDDPEQFKSGLRELFGILKYESDEAALKEFVQRHRDRCQNMDEDIYMALTILLGEQNRLIEMNPNEMEGGKRNMCKAFDQIEQKGIEKGEERVNILNRVLAQEKRIDDLIRATEDQSYQKQLFIKYGIS